MADIEYRPAIPDGTRVAKPALRNALVRRTIYVIEDSETPSDLVVNDAGVIPVGLAFRGNLFWLDATDTTSGPPDDVTLIVTDDGYRYFSDGLLAPVWSLLSQNDTTPPGSPAVGDAYHTSAAPAGDWAGYPNMIAVYTRRGWVFQGVPVGRLIYVQDEQSFYHMDQNGDFVLGTGTASLGNQTVRDNMLVGGQRFFIVENQTVNTPPSSPPVGIYWIVGPSPTGAWAGQTGKIATNYDGLSWTFITPTEGVHAYDRAQNALFRYDGGWINAAGAYVRQAGVQNDAAFGPITLANQPSGYEFSPTAAPTRSLVNRHEDLIVSIAADAAGKTLEFDYAMSLEWVRGAEASGYVTAALFRDSEAAAVDWQMFAAFPISTPNHAGSTVRFRIPANDAALHTYQVFLFFRRVGGSSAAGVSNPTISRRRLSVREVA